MVNYYIFSFVCSFIPCVLLRHLTHHVRQVFVSRISYLKSTCILLKFVEKKTYFDIKMGAIVIPLRYGAFPLTILRLKYN